MKTKFTLTITACIAFCLSACKKDNTSISTQNANTSISTKNTNTSISTSNASIIGKWNINQLHIVENNSTGVTSDTTLTATSFNAGDFTEFNTDNTAFISRSGGNAVAGGVAPDFISYNKYTYKISGVSLALTSTNLQVQSSGPITDTIKVLTSTNLVLHNTAINGSNKTVTDTYFVKAQ